jgi:hypothetical protein
MGNVVQKYQKDIGHMGDKSPPLRLAGKKIKEGKDLWNM